MAQYMCMDTLKFLLWDVHKAQNLLGRERFSGFEMNDWEMLLDAAKTWADQDFYPYYREMDEKPVYFKDEKIYAHPILKKIFKDAGENGWLGMYFDAEDGGIQLPHAIANATNHIFEAANNHIPGYLGLTSGAAHLIASFGSAELKEKFIPNMLNGSWGGTMALTEPQSGSSLSDIVTSAKQDRQNRYLITGQKIFISGGDHEAAENIVHLTLARIDGAPLGTKGISLFAVPKYRPEDDGSLSYNDVKAVSDFQKMGQRGYSTVHLVYGEQGDCHGYLVGEPNMGLKYMFQMMNGARIDVGMTAASTATAAYYASLQYAKERPQGRKILNTGKKDLSEGQTLIINHPDVRRMLLLQKAVVEGSLSLLTECALYSDLSHTSDGADKEAFHDLLELLTPIAKTYPAEMGRVSIDNGLQVLGGYGFCMDFPLQQYLRDIRIMSIYEGTTGIQSLDLLGRKVTMNNGRALQLLTKKILEVTEEASADEQLKNYADQLNKRMHEVQKALEYLIPYAMKGDYENYLADASIFMEMMSTAVVGYQWLKIALTSSQMLKAGDTRYDRSFYESKIHTMKFYFKYELPKTRACLDTILHTDKLTLPDDDVVF
jgi:alkylation response protein AidB-like acyl-CoA dehydrogenase